MCGIIAAASNQSVENFLIQGLHKMEYRGYDSAGIALHNKDKIFHLRSLGKVSQLADKMLSEDLSGTCLLYTSPSPRDYAASRMPSSA